MELRVSLARRIGRLLSPAGRRGRVAVFCYHQVLDAPDPNRPGEPTAEDFASDIALIDGFFDVLTFSEAASRLESGTLPSMAACVTFDDGYANNHALAAPILEKHGVPATFFVAGGAIDEGVMWNDLIIESIAAAGGWPKLPTGCEFLVPPRSGASSGTLVAHVLKQLKYRSMDERWELSCRLYENNVGADMPRLMMNRTMVRDLATRGFEIGGHTINHPILKKMSDSDAESEIAGCRDWVVAVTGLEPASFAYPNGRAGIDYDEKHVQMVNAAGFRAAASTNWGLATRTSNPLALPRIGPWWRQGRRFESGITRLYLRSYL